jgi:hypothetical protein
MRIDQALSILRRTGFVILVVASSLARAQGGPSMERGQAHGRVDPAIQVLEWSSGAGAARAAHRTLDPPFREAVARQIDNTERRRAYSASLAVLRAARRCAGTERRAPGSRRQGRSRATRSKARRAHPAARLGARRAVRRRRRTCSNRQRPSFAPFRRPNTSSGGTRFVDASTTRCGALPRQRALDVRGCSHPVSRLTGATMGRTRPAAAARPRRSLRCRRVYFPVSNPST